MFWSKKASERTSSLKSAAFSSRQKGTEMKRKRWSSNLFQRRDARSSRIDDPFYQMPTLRWSGQRDEGLFSENNDAGTKDDLHEMNVSEPQDRVVNSARVISRSSSRNRALVNFEETGEEIISAVQDVEDTEARQGSESAVRDTRLLPLKRSLVKSLLAITRTKRFSEEAYDMFSVFLELVV